MPLLIRTEDKGASDLIFEKYFTKGTKLNAVDCVEFVRILKRCALRLPKNQIEVDLIRNIMRRKEKGIQYMNPLFYAQFYHDHPTGLEEEGEIGSPMPLYAGYEKFSPAQGRKIYESLKSEFKDCYGKLTKPATLFDLKTVTGIHEALECLYLFNTTAGQIKDDGYFV